MKKPMMAKKGKAVMIVIGMKPKKKMSGGLMAATEKLKAKGLNKGGGADMGKDSLSRRDVRMLGKKGTEKLMKKRRKAGKGPQGNPAARVTGARPNRPINPTNPGFPYRPRPRPRTMMGGGMMQRPMMAMGGGMMPGYKKGKSVMAKGCKLGRKKPTKMYT